MSTTSTRSSIPLAALRATARRLALSAPGHFCGLVGPPDAPTTVDGWSLPDPHLLLGRTAPPHWRGAAAVVLGRLRPVEGFEPDPDGDVVVAHVVDRRGARATAVAAGHTVSELRPTAGGLHDLVGRVLGCESLPEATPSWELVLRVWLHELLDAVADPPCPGSGSDGPAPVATWADAVALHPVVRVLAEGRADSGADPLDLSPDELADLTLLAGRRLGWGRLRRLAGRGVMEVPGLRPLDALWMDDPFFARWTLAVHRPVTELVDDLRLFAPPSVLAPVEYTARTVGWLGFAHADAP